MNSIVNERMKGTIDENMVPATQMLQHYAGAKTQKRCPEYTRPLPCVETDGSLKANASDKAGESGA